MRPLADGGFAVLGFLKVYDAFTENCFRYGYKLKSRFLICSYFLL